MGLEESETLYPLLVKAERLISKRGASAKTDLYQLFMPGPIVERLNAFDGDSLEKVVTLYYRSMGFNVIPLGGSFPAIDLVVSSPDKVGQTIAIQVKSGRETQPKDLPHEGKFKSAKRHLIEDHSVTAISLFRWHSASKLQYSAKELLDIRVKACFGDECEIDVMLNEELVEELIARREIGLLLRIFSNEFTIDEKRGTHREFRNPNRP